MSSSVELVTDVLRRRFMDVASETTLATVDYVFRQMSNEHVAIDVMNPGVVGEIGDATDHHGLVHSQVMDELLREPRLVEFVEASDEVGEVGTPLVVLGRRFISVRRLASAEWRIAQQLRQSLQEAIAWPRGLESAQIDQLVANDQSGSQPELTAALRRLLGRQVSMITGGPGTGKTTLVAHMLSLLNQALTTSTAPLNVAITAPTGKAAVRVLQGIARATADHPLTNIVVDVDRGGSLNRLLQSHPNSPHRALTLPYDVVIVDEASMASLAMLDDLVSAAAASPQPCRVVIVGDPHQLASVNEGAVLADLVTQTSQLNELTTHLTTVHRTDQADILEIARAVVEGDDTAVTTLMSRSRDVTILPYDSTNDLIARLVNHACDVGRLAQTRRGHEALARWRQFVVLSALREGEGSVKWWNQQVGDAFRREFPRWRDSRFSSGEPVLVTRNQSAVSLSNGDVGVVVTTDDGQLVYFEGREPLAMENVGYLESAWAMTIHKSQGSEYDHVVVALPTTTESAILSRELLYTAVTRAQSHVTVVASREVVSAAVKLRVERTSGLAWRLEQLAQKR